MLTKLNNAVYNFIKIGILGCVPMTSLVCRAEAPTDTMPSSTTHIIEEQVLLPPLFEYVVAPEELPDLQSRTDYLMDHFWDPFDFKGNEVVDQNALNHAFGVYVQAMAYASEPKIDASVKSLISKIKNSPGLSYQFAKAAEENLYGPRAELWGDEVYMEFLKNAIANKKISDSKKKNLKTRLNLLSSTARGAVMPKFALYNLENTGTTLSPTKKYSLIEFINPGSEDRDYTTLRLDISRIANELRRSGLLEIFVVEHGKTKPEFEYPEGWTVYYSPEASDVLDLRIDPCFYVIDNHSKILGKNLNIDAALDLLDILSNNAKK